MKKFSLILLSVMLLPMATMAKDADGYSYSKDMYGELNIGYKIKQNDDTGRYYMGIHGGLSFMNWKNKYTGENDVGTIRGSDDFSFKSTLGLDIFVGYMISPTMRADLEIGYLGKFSETEVEYNENYIPEKTKFDFETYYLLANWYYNFKYGLYAGAGLGGALLNVSMDHTHVQKQSETSISPMAALTGGWLYQLDDKIDFDVRYRLAFFDGGNVTLDMTNGYEVKTEMGWVMDNSLSAGIRYKF